MTYRIYLPTGNHVRISADYWEIDLPSRELLLLKSPPDEDHEPKEVANFQGQQWTFICEEAAFQGLFTAPAETTP